MRRVKGHYERGRRASVEMQTCIQVEGSEGVVSMETKRKIKWRILLFQLL